MKHVLFAIFFAGILVLGFFYRVFGSLVWAGKAIFGRGKDDSLYEEIFIAIIAITATMVWPNQIGYEIQMFLYFVIVVGALSFGNNNSGRFLVILSIVGFALMLFGQDLFKLVSLEDYALLSVDIAPWPLYIWLIVSSRKNFADDLRLAAKKARGLVEKAKPMLNRLSSKRGSQGKLAVSVAVE